ncbi:MAG: hypothetical protein ACQEQ4_11150 [Fibrobacterota bacterium]
MQKIFLGITVLLCAVSQITAANIRYSGMVGGGIYRYSTYELDQDNNLSPTDKTRLSGISTHGILIDETFFTGATLQVDADYTIGFYVDGEYRFLRGKPLRPFAGVQVYPVPGYVFRYSETLYDESYLKIRAGVRKTLWGNFHVLGEVSMSNSLGVLVGIGI